MQNNKKQTGGSEKPLTKIELREKEIEASYKKVLATKEGRAVFWDLLSYSEIYGDPFTGNSSTFYKLGIQRVGKRIIERINASDPKAYAKLLMEDNDN